MTFLEFSKASNNSRGPRRRKVDISTSTRSGDWGKEGISSGKSGVCMCVDWLGSGSTKFDPPGTTRVVESVAQSRRMYVQVVLFISIISNGSQTHRNEHLVIALV